MATLQELAQAGIQALEDKRFNDAIASFEAALELDPSRPDMNNALGMAYLHRGDVGNGIPYFEKAVELAEPFDAPEVQDMKREFHLQLATSYQLMDRIDEAMRALQGVRRRWPDVPEPLLRLGALMFSTGALDDGMAIYEEAAKLLSADDKQAAEVLVAAVRAFLEAEQAPSVFLEAHASSYKDYFDEVANQQTEHGWYAESPRMARSESGELVPMIAQGAKPYAMVRVDLVNPATNEVSGIYSEQEPMIVAIEGLEPLAQFNILFPWKDWPFEVGVSTRSPWHWLQIIVQFDERGTEDQLVERIDELMGSWYLTGFNGDYGEKDKGYFHFITDPMVVGDRAVAYTVDLGRARYEAIPTLLNRLVVLHDQHRIDKVLFGMARLKT